jgi:hypothetical protein
MKKALDLPPELASLVEKRDKEDRRAPAGSQDKAAAEAKKPAVERRRGDRRKP